MAFSMKTMVFSIHSFERPLFELLAPDYPRNLSFTELRLSIETAHLADGCEAVAVFACDNLTEPVLQRLKQGGVRFIALRSAGFNHVDLPAARELGFRVARVPAYSPYAVAEHAVALLLSLNRKISRAVSRVRELNFSLDGLVGFDLHGKTIGVAGTGRIGSAFARIMLGFGCRVLAYDAQPNYDLPGITYVTKEELLAQSDVISLHIPLSPASRHLIDAQAIRRMKPGAFLINTSRGGLVDTRALIAGLKSGKIGAAGLDVYEEEENVFSHDLSGTVLQDDVLARLLTFPNVLITAHQAFLTKEALHGIVQTTLENLADFSSGAPLRNEVKV